MVRRISASVSPSPSIRLVLVSTSGRCALAAARTFDALPIAGARIAHRMGQALDRFHVLRENLQARIHDRTHMLEHAGEIGCQRLDRGVWIALLDRPHGRRVMRRAAVRQVVPIDRREHHVLEPHELDRARHVLRLLGIEPPPRIAGVDRAEAAGPGAYGAHEHDGGGAGIPAFADVGALRLLADGAQPMIANDLFRRPRRRHRWPGARAATWVCGLRRPLRRHRPA